MSMSSTRVVTSPSRSAALPSLGLVAIAFALVAMPSAVSAQETTVTSRLAVFVGGGFGGEVEIVYDGGFLAGTGSADLDATPVAGVRFEKAFLHYLAFGGELVSSFWRPSDENRRNPMLDLAITPRVRYPIVLNSRFMVEPYVVIPFGPSLAIWNDSFDPMGSGLDRANLGLVVGALAGATFLTRSHVGGMLEFGWIHHVAYDRDRDGGRYTMTLNQAVLRAGVVYAF